MLLCYDSYEAAVKNLKLKDILKEAGLGRNTISHMENGSMPRADNLARIADVLQCSVDYLLGRAEYLQ